MVRSVWLFDSDRWYAISAGTGGLPVQILESTDIGSTWTRAGTLPNGMQPFSIDPSNGREILALAREGIYRSKENGTAWEAALRFNWESLGLVNVPGVSVLHDPKSPYFYLLGSGRLRSQTVQGRFLAYSGDGLRTVKLLIPPTPDRYFKVVLGPSGGVYVDTEAREPDAFVAKYSPSGRQIFFSYLGGEGLDRATSVSVDQNDRILVGGITKSVSFAGTHLLTKNVTGYVAMLSPDGTKLHWCTRLPGEASGLPILTAAGTGGITLVASSGDGNHELSVSGSYLLELDSDGRLASRPADLGNVSQMRSMITDRIGNVLLGHRDGISRFSLGTRTARPLASIPGIQVARLALDVSGSILAVGWNFRSLPQREYGTLTTPNAFQREGYNGGDRGSIVIADGYVGRFGQNGTVFRQRCSVPRARTRLRMPFPIQAATSSPFERAADTGCHFGLPWRCQSVEARVLYLNSMRNSRCCGTPRF